MGPGGSIASKWTVSLGNQWGYHIQSIAYTVYVETHIHHWNYSGSELGLILKLLVVIYIDLQ